MTICLVVRESLKSKYGTRHVLVLSGFSPSLRTTDLEKLFVDSKDSGFLIRWVDDTTALAVFKTPSTIFGTAVSKTKDISENSSTVDCSQHGIEATGFWFGSKELRGQEAARKNCIVFRQKQRDDA
ncbi:unnamed protein product [Eruca vesicaria subsp. sativa]|uniref:Uncharacterized protein n=1 Tax=Eruca vesicaria subsp. sativa TaxID=29727 RepID=A0ABC8LI97_ERUVS|nr:unnamed protein product [Eruca vesicaria subsp. sativa]